MLQQTPNKRVLLRYRLAPVLLVLFGVFSILAFSLHAPQKAYADSSNSVNFQARLQTASGAIVPDDTYNVQFKLYSGSGCTPATGSGCTQEWTESYQNNTSNGVQVINGYLTVNLGSVTALPTTLNWDQPLYLSMNIGGTTTGTPTYDGEMKPYLKLTAVPYAFQAKSASQLQQLQGSYSGTLNFTTLTANRTISLPDANGTVCLQSSADCGFLNETTADGRYLQNSATLQTGNIYLQAASSGSVAATLQANASGTGDILDLLDGSGAKVLSVSNAGDTVIKPSDTSLTGFQVQNATKTIFDVDTTNGRVGIDRTDPGYALDVNGDINSTTAVRVGGVSVCTVSNCVPTSGSNNYIQNATGTQNGANINIRSVAANAVTAVVQGASGQTADILQVLGWDGTSTTPLMSVSSAGNLTAVGTIQGATLNATSGYSLNGTAGATTTCSGGQFLQNQVVQGGIVTGGACASAGNVTGSGTVGTIAMFSSSGTNLGNSILTQTGTSAISVGGDLSATGTITLGDSTTGNYIMVSGTGLTAYGTARHTKTILLPAEYAGGALDAASDSSCSAANSGIMASGFDNTTRQNYYEWVSNTGSTQCYDVVVQIPVPSDFSGWASAPTLYVANSSSSSSAVCVEAIATGGSIDSNYGGYSCTTTGSSLSLATLPTLNSTYTAGGYLTFKIRLSSTGNTNITKIGNLTLQYYSQY